MVPALRLVSHQLSDPLFEEPKEIVSWMGAIQAQNYKMAQWAIGIRSGATRQRIEEALHRGEILRTHVLRPTWHFVAAEDIRWMLSLSAARIRAALRSYGHRVGITEDMFLQSQEVLQSQLQGGKSLTKQELTLPLTEKVKGLQASHLYCTLMRAETDGLICSGINCGETITYALLEERAPQAQLLCHEEALALLATRYFKSHSPASLLDFVWWSGLSVTEAKQAIALIRPELIMDAFAPDKLLMHETYSVPCTLAAGVHLLPSYDEYLISYQNRTHVLELAHHRHAFTNNGIFYPVLVYQGKVIGNWKIKKAKGKLETDTSFFSKSPKLPKRQLAEACRKYRQFCGVD